MKMKRRDLFMDNTSPVFSPSLYHELNNQLSIYLGFSNDGYVVGENNKTIIGVRSKGEILSYKKITEIMKVRLERDGVTNNEKYAHALRKLFRRNLEINALASYLFTIHDIGYENRDFIYRIFGHRITKFDYALTMHDDLPKRIKKAICYIGTDGLLSGECLHNMTYGINEYGNYVYGLSFLSKDAYRNFLDFAELQETYLALSPLIQKVATDAGIYTSGTPVIEVEKSKYKEQVMEAVEKSRQPEFMEGQQAFLKETEDIKRMHETLSNTLEELDLE